jgi:hypothetical protein
MTKSKALLLLCAISAITTATYCAIYTVQHSPKVWWGVVLMIVTYILANIYGDQEEEAKKNRIKAMPPSVGDSRITIVTDEENKQFERRQIEARERGEAFIRAKGADGYDEVINVGKVIAEQKRGQAIDFFVENMTGKKPDTIIEEM